MKMVREILANASFEETRVAVIEDGRIVEIQWERRADKNLVGNIYKGQVENVLPGISSAFVNIGYDKNAYLYISDVLGKDGTHRGAIDDMLKKNQNIMIQVAKGAIGTKGMKVTMDIALPGRYLVFTPFQAHRGVSKQIGDKAERERLNSIMDRLSKQYLAGRGVVIRIDLYPNDVRPCATSEMRGRHGAGRAAPGTVRSAFDPAHPADDGGRALLSGGDRRRSLRRRHGARTADRSRRPRGHG